MGMRFLGWTERAHSSRAQDQAAPTWRLLPEGDPGAQTGTGELAHGEKGQELGFVGSFIQPVG